MDSIQDYSQNHGQQPWQPPSLHSTMDSSLDSPPPPAPTAPWTHHALLKLVRQAFRGQLDISTIQPGGALLKVFCLFQKRIPTPQMRGEEQRPIHLWPELILCPNSILYFRTACPTLGHSCHSIPHLTPDLCVPGARLRASFRRHQAWVATPHIPQDLQPPGKAKSIYILHILKQASPVPNYRLCDPKCTPAPTSLSLLWGAKELKEPPSGVHTSAATVLINTARNLCLSDGLQTGS